MNRDHFQERFVVIDDQYFEPFLDGTIGPLDRLCFLKHLLHLPAKGDDPFFSGYTLSLFLSPGGPVLTGKTDFYRTAERGAERRNVFKKVALSYI